MVHLITLRLNENAVHILCFISTLMCSTGQKFGNITIFNVFERSFFCSSSLHLSDQKYRFIFNIVIYYYNLNNWFSIYYTLNDHLFLWCKAELSGSLLQSITWSFRNHSNMMIHYQSWKQFCCLIFFHNLWYFFRILWWIKRIKKKKQIF